MNHKKIASAIAIVLAVLMLVTLVVSVIPVTAFAVTQEDIDAVQQRKEELLAQREASQAKINGLKEQQASVLEQKQALDERNTYAQEQLVLVREQVRMYAELIEQKAQEVEAARAVELEQLERYRTRVRAMEENGSFDMLSLLLHAKSFGELLSMVDDIGVIMERDKQLEDEYIAARRAFEEVKAEYEQTKAELDVRQAELEQEQAELEQMIAEATALLEELQQDIEKAQKEYEEAERARRAAEYQIGNLIAELNRQNAAIAAAQQAAAGGNSGGETGGATEGGEAGGGEGGGESQPAPAPTPAPSVTSAGSVGVVGTGSLVWPVPGSMRVTSRFGNRDDPMNPGTTRYHSGMDIDGYGMDGGAIVACDAGVVSKAAWYGGLGNCVIIDHGNGMQTVYGHMSGFAVKEGDTVSQGQTIGYLGATGWATGTHCHLEIFVNGGRVNPEGYFSGMTFYNC